MPLVSVIVNAHNGSRTLAETLDSVVSQTLRDIEIVFWDDASTDDTAAIAQRYAAHGLRYFKTPGGRALGLGAARQAAIQVAQGDWIAFIDQDDLWLPHSLAALVARGTPDAAVGMVYGRAVRFWPDGREVDFDHQHEFTALPEGQLFQRLFTESCFICISATLFRREAVLAAGAIPADIRVDLPAALYTSGTTADVPKPTSRKPSSAVLSVGSSTAISKPVAVSSPLN